MNSPSDYRRRVPRWRDPLILRTVAYAIVILAGSWWLLGQLQTVLRPLLVAVFMCYVLLPYYAGLRRSRVPGAVSIALLAGVAAGILVVLALLVYGSLLGLSDELPELRRRAVEVGTGITDYLQQTVPWLKLNASDGRRPEEYAADAAARAVRTAANSAAGGLLEAGAAGLYLLFLLLGAERLPGRVRAAYPPHEADTILAVAGRINSAVISYLRAKVKSSLILAVPIGVVLYALDVKFALLWAVLTFLCNFIPYIGSIVAYCLPVGFAVLQQGWGPGPFAAAGLLLALHIGSATVFEPYFIGRAVGLSPLVILAALAVWGTLWDLPGMFLAIPLTVVVKIVLENIALTRPVAKLAED
jgi:AI-2 transport protein TqsA